MTPKYTELTKDLLYEMYWMEGKTLQDIGAEIGCSFRTVANYMEKFRVKRRNPSEAQPKYTGLTKDLLYEMYWIEKKNTRAIGEEIGCTGVTVIRYMKKYGIKRRETSEGHKRENLSKETRKKMSDTRKGKRHSEETKKKISDAHKGKHHSEEARKKMSDAHKGTYPSEEVRKKLSDVRKGKKLSSETRKKISESHKGEKNPNYGTPLSEETRKRISDAIKGKKHYNWQGGISFGKYCEKFNEELKEKIRTKYGYKCFSCGKTQEENGSRLSVHHLDRNKMQGCNGIPWALVPLCKSCHGKVQYNNKLNNELFYKWSIFESQHLHNSTLNNYFII